MLFGGSRYIRIPKTVERVAKCQYARRVLLLATARAEMLQKNQFGDAFSSPSDDVRVGIAFPDLPS